MTKISPDPKISKGFYESICLMRENHECEDFNIKINKDRFSCHSFMLASCSEFFRCLLRSNMKEKQEMEVELKGISSPIFELILNTLYTGCELLTKENVLEVWSAVHQLQIQFLIEHCEEFVTDNLTYDTVESYKKHAEYLQSEKVCEFTFNYILKNFETLRHRELFFQLDFQYLNKLLQNDKLNVKSEDTILHSVFKWVQYNKICESNYSASGEFENVLVNTSHNKDCNETIEEPRKENLSLAENVATNKEKTADPKEHEQPNDRKKYLIPLLQSTRYCLATDECIVKLYNDELIQNDMNVKDILFKAFTFKFSDHWLGNWPTAAIHRDCSDLEHVGVYCDNEEISALSLKENKWFTVPKSKTLKYSKIIVFKGKLYACSMGLANNEIYVLSSNHWELLTVLKYTVQLLLTHEKCIYVLDSSLKIFIKFNPDSLPIQFENIKHELQNPEFALSFYNNIIVFCSVDNDGLEETAVHCWNTESNEWTQLDNLQFSSKNMTSFRDGLSTYILDCKGNLWKSTNTGVIAFTFVEKLWSVNYNVKGAVLFREALFIFGDSPKNVGMLNKVKGVYSTRSMWGVTGETSNFIHYVLPKSFLKPE